MLAIWIPGSAARPRNDANGGGRSMASTAWSPTGHTSREILVTQAVVIHSAHDLRIEPFECPTQLAADEVRVRVERGGICGSDLHYYHAGGFGAVRLKAPMVLGHEVSGRVVAAGLDAGVEVGRLVAVNPSMPCGRCVHCRAGMRNQCLDMRFNGSAMRFPHVDGLFRTELVVRGAQAVPLADGVSAAAAACAEPLAVCLAALAKAGPLQGRTVLVSGCGPIGCLTILAAAHAGAGEIIAVDVTEAPLRIASRMGATRVIDVSAGAGALSSLTADKGQVDTVFECSGNGAAMISALDVVRPRGTIVAVGLGGNIELPFNTVVAKEIVVAGTFRFDAEFGEACRLISDGAVDVSPLITATLPCADATRAFDIAGDRRQSMKVQIAFDA